MAKRKEDEPSEVVLVEDGIRKAILGYTWPGIEFGEPPIPAYTFFEYVDSVRQGDVMEFKRIQEISKDWWFPTLDRGAGALLHFAVDHGRLNMVQLLIEEEGVPVNQRSHNGGWTPLHRCAQVVHYTHAPFMEIFEYLLQHGADPDLLTYDDEDDSMYETPCSVLDLVVKKGYQRKEGEVRAAIAGLIEKYAHIKKQPEWTYEGPDIGPQAFAVMTAWESLPKLYPPEEWSGPVPPGFVGAMGMRLHQVEAWRPAGDKDGTMFQHTPPVTKEERKSRRSMG